MLTKEEILERLNTANTWRQSGVTIEDVKAILTIETEDTSKKNEVAELREKVTKQAETIKQLRTENKALKGR